MRKYEIEAILEDQTITLTFLRVPVKGDWVDFKHNGEDITTWVTSVTHYVEEKVACGLGYLEPKVRLTLKRESV